MAPRLGDHLKALLDAEEDFEVACHLAEVEGGWRLVLCIDDQHFGDGHVYATEAEARAVAEEAKRNILTVIEDYG